MILFVFMYIGPAFGKLDSATQTYINRHDRSVIQYIYDGLVQDWSNSNALAMELLQSCTKPSMYAPIPI